MSGAPITRMVAAEFLKLRRTLALGLAVVAPIAPAFFCFLIGLLSKHGLPPDANPWTSLSRATIEMWSFLMLPSMVALQAALMAQLESANTQWKHLYALPLSRPRLYVVKAGVVAALMTLSTALLVVYLLLAGALLGALKPETNLLHTAPEWAALLGAFFKPLVAVMFLLAIHQWVGQRWPSVAVALGLAVVGLTGCIAIIGSETYGRLFPWALPFRAVRPEAKDVTFILLYALGAAAVTLALGAWHAKRREMV